MAAKKSKAKTVKMPSRKCKRVFEASGKRCQRNALPDGEFCQKCTTILRANPAPAVEDWTLNVTKESFITQLRDIGVTTPGLEEMDQTELLEVYNNFDSNKIQESPAADEAPQEVLVLPEVAAGKTMLEKWDDIGVKRPLGMAKVPGKPCRFWIKPKDPRTIASKEISRMKLTGDDITIYCIYGPKWTWKRGEII